MSTAKVTSINALRDFKAAMQRFIEEASASVAEVDSEALQVAQWLRFEQITFWQSQARQRHEAVEAAKSELRRKQLTGMPDNPTAIDQRRAVDRARRREEEAIEKIQRVRRWFPVIERETTLYKGAIQPLMDAVARDLPAAMLRLDRMIRALEEYAALAATAAAAGGGAPRSGGAEAGDAHAEVASPFAGLRRRTPRRSVRQSLEAAAPMVSARREERIEGPPGGVLAQIDAPVVPVATSERVVLEVGAMESGAYYLERLSDVGAGDSGWHIGSASPGGAGEPGYEATTVGQLLGVRPGLEEILRVPPGHVIVVMGGSAGIGGGVEEGSVVNIEAIVGPDDRQVYP